MSVQKDGDNIAPGGAPSWIETDRSGNVVNISEALKANISPNSTLSDLIHSSELVRFDILVAETIEAKAVLDQTAKSHGAKPLATVFENVGRFHIDVREPGADNPTWEPFTLSVTAGTDSLTLRLEGQTEFVQAAAGASSAAGRSESVGSESVGSGSLSSSGTEQVSSSKETGTSTLSVNAGNNSAEIGPGILGRVENLKNGLLAKIDSLKPETDPDSEPNRIWMLLSKIGLTSLAGIISFVAVVTLGAWHRFRYLALNPPGFHGDEAVAGFEMARVLDEGWIGLWSRSALGQPAIPFYLGAPIIKIFGLNVTSVRSVAALGGTLAVAAIWLCMRRYFSLTAANFAALSLALLPLNVHFSRIGFPMAWWPLFAILAIAAVAHAEIVQSWRAWALAGFAAGFGVYIYNAHWLFGAVVGLFGIYRLAQGPKRLPVLAAVVGGVVGVIPMVMALSEGDHTSHFTLVSRTDEILQNEEIGAVAKIRERYVEALTKLVEAGHINGVDGSGAGIMLPKVHLLLAALGLIGFISVLVSKWRSNSAEMELRSDTGAKTRAQIAIISISVLTILIMPFAGAMTDSGDVRRSSVLSVGVVALAGVGGDWVWNKLFLIRRSKPATLETSETVEVEQESGEVTDVEQAAGEVTDVEQESGESVEVEQAAAEVTDVEQAVSEVTEVEQAVSEVTEVAQEPGELVEAEPEVTEVEKKIGIAHLGFAAIITLLMLLGLSNASKALVGNDVVRWIFVEELAYVDRQVSQIVEERTETDPTNKVWVNWYSARHLFEYETFAFLRGDKYTGVTKSPLGEIPETIDWVNEAPSDHLAVYVLVGEYANRYAELQALEPGIEIYSQTDTPRIIIAVLES